MKTAVVTGGSGYVGSAIVEKLLDMGYRVINISRSAIQREGVENVLCDLSNEEETRNAAEQIKHAAGSVDIFVHAACPPTTRVALEATPPEARDREFAVAVEAPKIFAEALSPCMKEGSLFIGITTASLDKDTPEKNIGAYIPAKAALRELLNKLRTEWKGRGIQVEEIAPVFMPGGLNKHLPEGVLNILARQQDGTASSANDVAEKIEKLAG